MKKTYSKPVIQVLEIYVESTILARSKEPEDGAWIGEELPPDMELD